jgi:hypothetical protein
MGIAGNALRSAEINIVAARGLSSPAMSLTARM